IPPPLHARGGAYRGLRSREATIPATSRGWRRPYVTPAGGVLGEGTICDTRATTPRHHPRTERATYCSEPSQKVPLTLDPMCGIVGYVGPRPSQDILLAGLARLEYRGYDSAGVAVIDGEGTLGMRKKAGKLSKLRDSLVDSPLNDGTTGIGHTRWATHGGPTDVNAHPHLADDDKLAVIHNGIIENFAALREVLDDPVV